MKNDYAGKKKGGFGGKKFGGNSYGGKKFGDRKPSFRGGYGDQDEPREMHNAVCATCGTDCQVPFKPNGRKPVLCKNCFVRDEASVSSPFIKKSYNDRNGFKDVPYARESREAASGNGNAALEKRLSMIEQKLDNLLDLLSDGAEAEG
jgi:CxxC-x17-CxxC domain-containing protein